MIGAVAGIAATAFCVPHAYAEPAAQPDEFTQAHAIAAAKNPVGIRFQLVFPEGRAVFHRGEPISVMESFTSDRPGAYQLQIWNFPATNECRVDPASGAAVPDADSPHRHVFFFHGFAPAPQPLDAKPVTLPIVLNRYYRFDRPGHYRLYAASHRVDPLPVPRTSIWPRTTTASEIVDFEILPADPAWEQSRLDAIRKDLDSPDQGTRIAAAMSLRYLATDDAAQEMLSRLKSAPENGDDFIEGLYEARDRDFMLDRLKNALADPGFGVSEPLLTALVRLDITARHPLPIPEPAESVQEDYRRDAEREKTIRQETPQVEEKYLRMLRDVQAEKRGRARGVSLATLLVMEAQTPGDRTGPAETHVQAESLRPLLDTLTPEEQAQLLSGPAWNALRSTGIVPYLEQASRLHGTIQGTPEVYDLRMAAIKRLISVRPAEARDIILGDIRSGKPELGFQALAMLPDGEIPALDPILKRAYISNDGTELAHNQVILGLIGRYASRSLLPFARSLYPSFHNPPEQAYLLAYFLRVDRPHGQALVDGILSEQSRVQKTCYLLQEMASAIPCPTVEQTVRAHLGDKDPLIAADARTAMQFLTRRQSVTP
jgi:hypothetical protein